MSFKKQHLWIDRKDKRISLSLPCRVLGPDQQSCDARIINLSAGGMKFACNRETFERLLPESQRTPGMISDVSVEVSFALDHAESGQPATLRAGALLIHSERLAQDSYHVGIQFTSMNETDGGILRSFVSAGLKRNSRSG